MYTIQQKELCVGVRISNTLRCGGVVVSEPRAVCLRACGTHAVGLVDMWDVSFVCLPSSDHLIKPGQARSSLKEGSTKVRSR